MAAAVKVKTFLYSVRNELKEIRQIEERIREMDAALLPAAIRYDRDRVQTSPRDLLPEIAAKRDGYERILEKKLVSLYTKRAAAQSLIDTLEKAEERIVLSLFFLSDTRPSMKQVAERIGYSEAQTYRYYKSAFEHLETEDDSE